MCGFNLGTPDQKPNLWNCRFKGFHFLCKYLILQMRCFFTFFFFNYLSFPAEFIDFRLLLKYLLWKYFLKSLLTLASKNFISFAKNGFYFSLLSKYTIRNFIVSDNTFFHLILRKYWAEIKCQTTFHLPQSILQRWKYALCVPRESNIRAGDLNNKLFLSVWRVFKIFG